MATEVVWNQLRTEKERPVFRRIDESHPHDIYIGWDLQEKPTIMLVSTAEVDQVPKLKALDILQNVRHDGRYAILISLASTELFHPFCYVCDDLVEALRHFHAPGEAAFLIARLEKWRRLMELNRRGLSTEQLLGLIGELLFLESLIPIIGAGTAMDAWLGPSGAPQDFQISGRIYEIKVCSPGAHIIKISSLEQLHTADAPTALVVFVVGLGSPISGTAFSLNDIVERMRAAFSGTVNASLFELKLAEVGYDDKQAECSTSLFILDKVRAFNVTSEFPRLTPLLVPTAVTQATYSIDLDQCTQYETGFAQVLPHES